jgi:hypothetical protein
VVVVAALLAVVGSSPNEMGADRAATPQQQPVVAKTPWLSGATMDEPQMAGWRSRPLDVARIAGPHYTWSEIANPTKWINEMISRDPSVPLLALSLPLWPDTGGDYASCIAGEYDKYWTSFAKALVGMGRGGSVLSLGWEANINADVPWAFAQRPESIAGYRECWRRAAMALKAADPTARLSWNMGQRSDIGNHSVLEAYPGDDVVDEVAVDYYDVDKATSIGPAWDEEYMKTQNGGPSGIGSWLVFAKTHGKKLGVPEWGLWSGDDPAFISEMYNFFAENAGSISYESYYNGSSPHASINHKIFPSTAGNPIASQLYRQLWSASPRP